MAKPELSPILQRFLESTEGKRDLHIIGPDIEAPPQVTLLEQDNEERYYSLEVNQATGHSKEIVDVVLTPEGNWQDFRRRTYAVDDKLVMVGTSFKDPDDAWKSIVMRLPSLTLPNVPIIDFFSGGFFTQYVQKGHIKTIGYDKGTEYKPIIWEQLRDGDWTPNHYQSADAKAIGSHQIAINRTNAQLKIMENSTKNQITFTAPLRLNANSWFYQMSVPNRSWLNLARDFPLKLQIISPLNPQGRPPKES